MEKRAFKVFMCVSVLERVLGGVLGVDGGWMPLPIHPQRYCDPASLVLNGMDNASSKTTALSFKEYLLSV